MKESPLFAFRHRNDDLAATLGGLSTTGGLRGGNLMGEMDPENASGTRAVSAKKKAFLLKIELREAKLKAVEIDKLIAKKDLEKLQEEEQKVSKF